MRNQAIATLATAVFCALSGIWQGAWADTSDKRIALSNNYAGNSWRQAMLQSWDTLGKEAVAAGVVAQVDAFTTAESQVTEQAAQIQNLILEGYDAIVLNAASATALNGVVKEACDAGVVVVSFDGVVSEPCAWRLVIDFKKMGSDQIDYLASRLPQGGNILEIRGMAGVSVDEAIHAGILAGVAKHPQFKIVGSVHADWAGDVAQRVVAGILPSLPEIVGVVTQGGDGYGAAQAFAAARRTMPIIIMGNRQDELQWWQAQHDANGYTTMSASVAPAVAGMAFWIAQQILDGKTVKKDLVVPTLRVTQDGLAQALAATPVGNVYNTHYTQADAVRVIAGNQ